MGVLITVKVVRHATCQNDRLETCRLGENKQSPVYIYVKARTPSEATLTAPRCRLSLIVAPSASLQLTFVFRLFFCPSVCVGTV